MSRVVIVGSNFGGTTAALELKRKLPPHSHVQVISPTENFLYVPSLIWLPFGKRNLDQISFNIKEVYAKNGVEFTKDSVTKILPEKNIVQTLSGKEIHYDYLVIASGAALVMDAVSGMETNSNCIVTPPLAQKTQKAFESLIKNPGPVVIGATQGASCMGAAYEYLFNFEKQLRKHGVREKVQLTWITPEPFLGHFGIGGVMGGEAMLKAFMKMFKIDYRTDCSIKEVRSGEIELSSGEKLPTSMSMLIPPFKGQPFVFDSPGLGDEKGFIPCLDSYQHEKYDNIYAAGLAVQVKAPFKNMHTPFGVPKTGFPTDVQGKLVAHNIAVRILGKGKIKGQAFGKIPGICIMDAGDKEVLILTNHLFKPRQFEIMIPNVIFNFGKILLEKYMILKNKLGLTYLP